MIRLPHLDQCSWERRTAVCTEYSASQNESVTRLVRTRQPSSKWRTEPVKRTHNIGLGDLTGMLGGKSGSSRKRAAKYYGRRDVINVTFGIRFLLIFASLWAAWALVERAGGSLAECCEAHQRGSSRHRIT
jgi:hypothetical protein